MDIHTYYEDSYVLQGVSLKVDPGLVVALLGRNGVGKTTLIRSIVCFTPPRSGRIIFKGIEITRMPAHQIIRSGIGLVPQGMRVFSSLSVKENLEIAARGKEHMENLDWVYNIFPRLKERSHHKGRQLSGGEQQMLAIGRSLMANPTLLLLDEPSAGLAPLLVRGLAEVIGQLKEGGQTMVLVEQNVSFALSIADFAYVMSKGKIVFQSSPEILSNNEEIKSRYLGF